MKEDGLQFVHDELEWVWFLNIVVQIHTYMTRSEPKCLVVWFNHYTTIKIYLYKINGYNTDINRYQTCNVECQFLFAMLDKSIENSKYFALIF